MFNAKTLAIAQTADMPVRDAAGEPQLDGETPITLTFYSPASKQHQAAKHAAENRNNNRVFARMQGAASDKQTADDKLKEDAEFLAACTASFNGFYVEGLEQLAGHELYKAAYSDIEIGHIADDARKFLASRANFLKRQPKV